VRLGAATVVRLEGALAHEVLRWSRGTGDSVDPCSRGGGTGRGLGDRNRQARGASAPPERPGGPRGAMGMRKRSQTRSVNDTGAPEEGSNRRGSGPEGCRTHRYWGLPHRVQGDTP
jgi:hypothetical protein